MLIIKFILVVEEHIQNITRLEMKLPLCERFSLAEKNEQLTSDSLVSSLSSLVGEVEFCAVELDLVGDGGAFSSSVSAVVRATNCVRMSLIRCIQKFDAFWLGAVSVPSASFAGRESGPVSLQSPRRRKRFVRADLVSPRSAVEVFSFSFRLFCFCFRCSTSCARISSCEQLPFGSSK